ncbi:MAG: AraC family transcriptional regulator, partial [Mesorhizobium sp.]
YMNISNFNRAFLRKHKMTPSSYRKLSRHRLAMRA